MFSEASASYSLQNQVFKKYLDFPDGLGDSPVQDWIAVFPLVIKEIPSQNCYILKVLRSFILFCCQRKSLAVFTSLHEGAGEANSFGSNGCLTQEKQLTEVTSAPLAPLVLYPSPLPEEAFLQGYFVIETGK